MLILPALASSRASILPVSASSVAKSSAARCSSISATKRDICVPFCSAGSDTVMLMRATVACSPDWLRMRTGKRKSLMPTWLMGMLRTSGVLCTSGMEVIEVSLMGVGNFKIGLARRAAEPCGSLK